MKLLRLQQVLLLLLLLRPVLLQSSNEDDYHAVYISGCSDSDKEDMVGMNENQKYYADFVKKKEVYTLPKFGDPVECPGCYEQAVANQQTCQNNLQVTREAMKDFPLELDPPGTPLLFPKDHLRPSQPNTLLCQASGFYPAPVIFSWTRDGLNISSSSVSQAYPQSDGSFSQLSTLQILPVEGEVYSCSLKHPALRGEKKTRLWTVQFQKPSLAPSVFCAVGLTLGLVGVAVGTFFLVKGNECR